MDEWMFTGETGAVRLNFLDVLVREWTIEVEEVWMSRVTPRTAGDGDRSRAERRHRFEVALHGRGGRVVGDWRGQLGGSEPDRSFGHQVFETRRIRQGKRSCGGTDGCDDGTRGEIVIGSSGDFVTDVVRPGDPGEFLSEDLPSDIGFRCGRGYGEGHSRTRRLAIRRARKDPLFLPEFVGARSRDSIADFEGGADGNAFDRRDHTSFGEGQAPFRDDRSALAVATG
jgi:hypothetical protein